MINGLRERGFIAEYDGAVWLRGEPLGLPKDRVLVRSGPAREPTYRTPDIAYHIEKLQARLRSRSIDVFGADHIAEHQGVIAAVKALGYDVAPIHAIIYQFVTLTRGGEKVKMSTRKATYVTLDELIDEVGADVVRFFFLFRKHDSHLDFDLDLAKRQAPENPVFYVQYAHARLASVFREAEKNGLDLPADACAIDLTLLSDEELDAGEKAVGMPRRRAAARSRASSRIESRSICSNWPAISIATTTSRSNRIIEPEQRELSLARLFLARVLKDAIAGGLGLLGVSAPDRM